MDVNLATQKHVTPCIQAVFSQTDFLQNKYVVKENISYHYQLHVLRNRDCFPTKMSDKHLPSFGSFGTSLVPRFTYFMSQSNICTSQCTEISTSSQRCESADKYSAKYFISFTKRSRGQVKSCFTKTQSLQYVRNITNPITNQSTGICKNGQRSSYCFRQSQTQRLIRCGSYTLSLQGKTTAVYSRAFFKSLSCDCHSIIFHKQRMFPELRTVTVLRETHKNTCSE